MRSRRIIEGDVDLAKIPLRILRERLRELIALRDTNPKEVSLNSGNSETYVRDILVGRSNNPRMSALQAIADVLMVPLQYLLGQSDTITADSERRGIHPMPVLYIAETGAFRPMLAKAKTSSQRTIHADLNASYPHAKHCAADVQDDSMDRANLISGMSAVCVDLATAKIPVESGKLYVIRRTLDGGKHWETIIRRAMVYTDRIEYRPESTDEDYETLTVPSGSQMDNQGAQVDAVALVYGGLQIFY